jgi:predicted NAD-dependent protein-ADP-ribosyltransferase YbiA (DUF1768 family)
MLNEENIRAIQSRQFGLVTRAQAESSGFTRRVIGRRVESLQWERLHPNVYRDTLVRKSGEQAALAAVLWAGAHAVVSHDSAAALWRLDGIRATDVHLWVPRHTPLAHLGSSCTAASSNQPIGG